MAKPFNPQVNIQPQTISTGQPQQLMDLAGKLDAFASQSAQFVAEKQIAQATAEGKAAAQQVAPGEQPQFKEQTFVSGIAKKAFNTSLRASYVAGVDSDLTLGINELKTKYSSDLGKFNDGVGALVNGVIEGADPATREMIMQSAGNTIQSARLQVQANTIKREMTASDESLQLSTDVFGEESELFAFNGDDLSSSESLLKVFNANQARVDSGKITPAQSKILNEDAVQRTRIAKNRGELNKVLLEPGGIEIASQAVAELHSKPLKNMSIKENDALVKTLNNDITQFIKNENRKEVADQEELEARQDQNFSNLSVQIYEGFDDAGEILKQSKLNNISIEQTDKLLNRLGSSGAGIDNQVLINDINQRLADGDSINAIRLQIDNNAGSSLTFATAGQLSKMVNEYASSESVLNTNNTKRARSFMKDSMKITGFLGNLTDDAAKKTAASVREFDQRVLDGEDPFIVADDLYDRDSLIKLDSQMSRKFDTNNVSGTIDGLTEQFRRDAATFTGAELENKKNAFNRELKLLRELQQLQISQNQFNKSLKELK